MSEPNQGTLDAPKIDGRTAAEIVTALVNDAAVGGLLETYTTHTDAGETYTFTPWRDRDPATGAPRGRSAALIGVFARFAEVLIERLNRVPEKNLLAFLDLLGGERLPPSPARAPLTFTLAAGRVEDARVPAHTRVAAPPPPGGKDPVEFETERDLVISAARLASLITVEPDRDRYGDFTANPTNITPFAGGQQVEHLLYLGDSELLGYAEIKNLRLRISIDPAAAPITDPRTVVWEHWDGAQWQPLPPTADPTGHLTRSGTIHFGPFPPALPTPWAPPPETEVAGRRGRWLRARLLTPITPSADAVPDSVRKAQLPPIRRIVMAVHIERTAAAEGIAPDLAFYNGAPIDFGKPFFPFGERPRRFDTLFLASAEAFAKDRTACLAYSSARVEVAVTLANPHSLPAVDSVRPSPDLALVWECFTGTDWEPVGTSGAPDWLALVELDPEPVLATDANGGSTLLVQGTAAAGAMVTARHLSENEGPGETGPQHGQVGDRLRVGADGRFAVRYPIDPKTLIVEVRATRGAVAARRRELAWAVVPGPKAMEIGFEILADPATQPVDSELLVLAIKLTGNDAGEVERLRVTSGRADLRPEEITVGQPLEVALQPGRNALLIEALSGTRRLAATTLGVSRVAPAPVPVADFADGTHGLTESGLVRLRLPATMGKTAVNGQEGFWLRARIAAGDYGRDASYVLKDPVSPEEGFLLVPASFRPPVVAAIRLGYELTPRRPPTWCLNDNDRAYREVRADGSAPFVAFMPGEDTEPALYLGFVLPDETRDRFPRNGLDLYARVETPLADPRLVPPRISWEYWNGAAWAGLAVVDDTAQLTRSGALSLLPPPDFARRLRFGLERWWLRARLAAGQFDPPLRLGWLRLNTVAALQVSTIDNETLGSGNGTEGQVFRAARAPLLAGVRLEVREPGRPAAADLAALAAELLEDGEAVLASGEDLLSAAGGRVTGVWVRWREVPDFHGSGPADRHFVLNHLTGEVRLGNGVNGRIPPPGTSNLRLARYRTGGGASGNVIADTITQLKTTVPYVDKVTNPEPAVGGAEAETLASLKARIPRSLRHQDRAVTPEDLHDLALLASIEVARVLCVPLRALDRDPLGADFTPGATSVVIVPRADDPKPLPTLELLGRVRDYLAARADATARLAVVGPLYLQVTVQAEVALTSPAVATETEQALRARLDAFLHPLTGGLDGRGWDFGRAPHRSDFFVLIEQTPGVDHCRRLELTEQEDTAGVRATGRFLVYAGAHQLDFVFVET